MIHLPKMCPKCGEAFVDGDAISTDGAHLVCPQKSDNGVWWYGTPPSDSWPVVHMTYSEPIHWHKDDARRGVCVDCGGAGSSRAVSEDGDTYEIPYCLACELEKCDG